MTEIETILKQLKDRGIRIKVKDGNLNVTFTGEVSQPVESLLNKLRIHKQEAIVALTVLSPPPNVLELVPLLSGQHRINYVDCLQAGLKAGQNKWEAERIAAEEMLHECPIVKALYIAAWYWETFVSPTGGGDHAWSWIHAHEIHGSAIRASEADIDRIGAKGDQQELQCACNAYVDAWRKAIGEWIATR